MAITKQKKQELYAKVTEIAQKNPVIVFVNFHKLTVAEATALRRGLRAEKVQYLVAKKSIIKKALADAKIAGEMPALDGELAIAFSEDLTAPAREVFSFQKKFDKRVSILGGVFEGAFKGQQDMLAIAMIPSRKTLYAQIANILNSPMQKLAIGLNQIAEKRGATPTA